jgi:2-polyprenyl-6-methoxyphenol hydroxylase-like FAD-dependent oxidoreductase
MSDVVIVGAGICGLTLALALHQRNIPCRVFERAPRISELGVGITLLPHAMRELAALGLDGGLAKAGIENRASRFFNRFGQLIYQEPRGRFAGYAHPEIGIHRGRLQMALYRAACERLGAERIVTDRQCVAVQQDATSAIAHFQQTSSGQPLPPVQGAAVVACDGVNSAVRRQLHPGDALAFAGINTWRGVTRRKPILDGRTYLRIGSILTGKMVIYPIVDDVDGDGNQLVNWVAEIKQEGYAQNDWNKPGSVDDFLPIYASWRFDWLDVPELIRTADQVLEYPMVDKDPLDRWTFGRVTLAGDAAHPMYPRGSNGSAQAMIDARALAQCLAREREVTAALGAYEAMRRPPTTQVVRTNRDFPPDFINIKVEQLVGDRPFDDLDRYITQAELAALSDEYKRIAGFALRNGDDT